MKKTNRTWLGLRLLASAAVFALAAACGGSSDTVADDSLDRLSGVYSGGSPAEGTSSVVVIDAGGRFIAIVSARETGLNQYGSADLVISGTVTAQGNAWSSTDAQLGQRLSGYDPSQPSTTMTASIHGTFTDSGSVTFSVSAAGLSPLIPRTLAAPHFTPGFASTELRPAPSTPYDGKTSLAAIGGDYYIQWWFGEPDRGAGNRMTIGTRRLES